MDQIAVIQWIRKNAESFGGNPNNLTVFGESAGGWSVNMLMTSPLAAGLFQRAMAQSGGGREIINATGLRQSLNGRPSAEQIGVAFATSKGIRGDDAKALKELRALPAEAIVSDLNMTTTQAQNSTFAGPMIDGEIVTERFDQTYSEGKNQKVPMLAGANSMDIGFAFGRTPEELFAAFGPKSEAARKAYDPSGSGNMVALRVAVGADALMLEPARFALRTLAAQGQPVWEYRFSYVASSMRSQWPGGLESGHRLSPAVVAKDKFVQINLELIAAHTVISADQPLLQVANGTVRQRHCGCGAFAQVGSQRLIARHMLEASLP